MNKIICDKCGKEVIGKKYLVTLKRRGRLYLPGIIELDLCDECGEELLKYRVEE